MKDILSMGLQKHARLTFGEKHLHHLTVNRAFT